MEPRHALSKQLPLFLALTLVALALPAPARAQYTNIFTGRTFSNPLSASLDTFVAHGIQKRMMYRTVLRKKGYSADEIDRIVRKLDAEVLRYMKEKKSVTDSPGEAKPAARPAARPANLVPVSRFKPTGKRLLLSQAAEAVGTTAEEKAAYKTIFAEVAKAYEAEAKRLGFANDIAGTMAFFVDASHTLYRPGISPISDAGTRALVRQFQDTLNSDALRKSSDKDKQKLYEYYLSLGAYLYTLSEVAKEAKDETAKTGAAKLGGEGLKFLLKVDPSRVSLTENGLEIAPE